MIDQNARSKKIHLLLGLLEQLNSTHSPQLPDVGIWRSHLTNRVMLTGRIDVSKELVTKELPLLNVHKSILEQQEDSKHQIDLKEVEDFTSINNIYMSLYWQTCTTCTV